MAGRPFPFVFTLMDHKRAKYSFGMHDDYPDVQGYVLLVGPARPELTQMAPSRALRQHLCSVVVNAAYAEFSVYRKCPEVDLSPLGAWFVVDGPAYRRIRNIAESHQKQRRTLTEPPYNPSMMQVLKVKADRMTGDRAIVRTQEYWYLRWWSLAKEGYEYVYNDTNHQRYDLTYQEGRWLVDSNAYPPPRAIALMRRPRQSSGKRTTSKT
jgi:hypothetical protein